MSRGSSHRAHAGSVEGCASEREDDDRAILDDMDRGIADGRYVPDGETWHEPTAVPSGADRTSHAECPVCLGGALFRRFGVRPDEKVTHTSHLEAGRITEAEMRMLDALDNLRLGRVREAGRLAGADPSTTEAAQPTLEPDWNRFGAPVSWLRRWKERDRAYYVRLADRLEKHGL